MAKEKQENELETTIETDDSIDVAVEQKEKNLVSETKKTISVSNLMRVLSLPKDMEVLIRQLQLEEFSKV